MDHLFLFYVNTKILNNQYIYSYTYHLDKNTSGSAEVLEENNYYPFGLKHEGYNPTPGNPAYKYQYGGKELQNETGWNDFGARMYMADIARWGAMDPLAESNHDLTTYRYGFNNPVMFTDPNGMLEKATIDKVWNLGGGWTNTGDGFESNENIKIGYDGSYLSLNTKLEITDPDDVDINLPELVLNLSRWKYAFTGNYLFNKDKISIFNHLNKYIGAMSTITQWDGDRGFRGNWANSDNFWAKLSYGMANNFYLGLQMVDTFNFLDAKRMSGYTGREAFSNLDGTSQFDSGNRLMAFATTFNPFGPKLTVNVPATFGAIGESILPQAAFRLTDDLAPLSASQFSMLFKGTAISRAAPATRGLLNSYLNKGLNGVNSVGLYRTIAPSGAKAILPYNNHNNR